MSAKNTLTKYLWIAPLVIIPILLLFYTKSDGQGKQLYEYNCANCHMENGAGLRNVIPPLAGADYLQKYSEQLPCLIKNGLQGEIEVNGQKYNQVMPANPQLSEADIANIINYIRNQWGNEHKFMPVSEVKEHLENCE